MMLFLKRALAGVFVALVVSAAAAQSGPLPDEMTKAPPPEWKMKIDDGRWREVAATTASETLIGEWDLRIYSRFSQRLDKHDRFTITSIDDGVLTGEFERSEDTPFLDGTVREEDGRTLLSFRVPATAIYWTQMGGEDGYRIDAEFSDGRFTGTAMGETSGLKTPWYVDARPRQ